MIVQWQVWAQAERQLTPLQPTVWDQGWAGPASTSTQRHNPPKMQPPRLHRQGGCVFAVPHARAPAAPALTGAASGGGKGAGAALVVNGCDVYLFPKSIP